MAGMDAARYAHSPAHHAVAAQDHAALRRVLDALPRAGRPEEIRTEADSVAEEARAEAVSAVIYRRDVPGRETPLHLAVRLCDAAAIEMLMAAVYRRTLRALCLPFFTGIAISCANELLRKFGRRVQSTTNARSK